MFLSLKAENVFDSNQFCYLFSRFINFEFVTIERSKHNGTVSGYTSKWDVLKFIIGFSLGLFTFYDVISTPLRLDKRSIVFELMMSINGKIHGITGSLVMLQVFLFRNEYLKVFMAIDWIDKEVCKCFLMNIYQIYFFIASSSIWNKSKLQ